MPSLMVDFIMSLDGYGAADGWPGLWGMEVPEYLAWIKEDEEAGHTTLMGATTYRLMSGYAGEMPDDPGLAALTALPKVVFSSTLARPLSWANTELVDMDPVETVMEMKRRGSRPLSTVGSLSLCRSLLQAGEVDRFRVVVFPVITGATGRTESSTGIPTSPSTWSRPAPSTVGSSCSSTFPLCSMDRLASATHECRVHPGAALTDRARPDKQLSVPVAEPPCSGLRRRVALYGNDGFRSYGMDVCAR